MMVNKRKKNPGGFFWTISFEMHGTFLKFNMGKRVSSLFHLL